MNDLLPLVKQLTDPDQVCRTFRVQSIIHSFAVHIQYSLTFFPKRLVTF